MSPQQLRTQHDVPRPQKFLPDSLTFPARIGVPMGESPLAEKGQGIWERISTGSMRLPMLLKMQKSSSNCRSENGERGGARDWSKAIRETRKLRHLQKGLVVNPASTSTTGARPSLMS